MQLFDYIKWYHIIIICLLGIILFLIFIPQACLCPLPLQQNAPKSSQENFKSEIEEKQIQNQPNNDYLGEIVLYYASWCGHCKQLLPEWDKFEEFGKNKMTNIKVTKINCEDENEKICSQKEIKGYPTIRLYPKNKPEIEYSGERNQDKLIEFILNNISS